MQEQGVTDDRWSNLTPAERRVIALVSEGLTNINIAERLSVSPRTVQRHLYSVFRKLGVSSRTGLAAAAFERRTQQEATVDMPRLIGRDEHFGSQDEATVRRTTNDVSLPRTEGDDPREQETEGGRG